MLATVVIRTTGSDPDNLVNNRMPSIVSASIHGMCVVDTAADGKLLDYANTHVVRMEFGLIAVLS